MMYDDVSVSETIKGIKYWKNPKNKFNVIMLHYTADPNRDPNRDGKEWFDSERAGVPLADWNKEYEIDFSSRAGKLIFGSEFCDFSPQIHFINSFEIEKCEYLLSLDFGQNNPTASLVGAWTEDNRLYIIDEYYKPALPSVSSREMFNHFKYLMSDSDDFEQKSISQKRQHADITFQIKVIDPSTSAKNRTKVKEGEEIPYSVIEDFYDHGWDFEPGNNEIEAGITRIREYFQLDSNGKSHLYIFKDKCPNLCIELLNYRYKKLSELQEKTRNQSEEPVKKNDHALDSLRYMIMTRPYNLQEAPKPKTRIQRDIENLTKPKILNFDDDSVKF
ncbi:MAG: hypothetical protein Q8L27_04730 [archaeon]|nr:hypothetical protein [archaeon]